MTLTYEQLKQTNLKGYKFLETGEGYTMTGWGTTDERFVVLEDDGENCSVALLDDLKRTKRLSKDSVARKIAKLPLTVWSKEKNAYVNSIVEL